MLIESLNQDTVMEIYSQSLMEMAKIVLPILLGAVVIGVASNFFQFGFLFTTEQLKFDLKKMDPIKGIKKIISLRAIINLIKSLLKVAFIGTVTAISYLDELRRCSFSCLT